MQQNSVKSSPFLNLFRSKNEKRNLKKALRKAKQHLSQRKKILKDKKQLLLLITFGSDESVTDRSTKHTRTNVFSRIGKKFSRDDVTVAIVGIGKEAINQKSQLMGIVPADKSKDGEKYVMFSEEEFIKEILEFSVKFSKFIIFSVFESIYSIRYLTKNKDRFKISLFTPR